MARKLVDFRTDKRFVRRARELETLYAMILMYCRHHHGTRTRWCSECTALAAYSERRLERCIFGDAKPTCSNCVVHCYRADRRERIRQVMRWAGPRMLLRHPLLALRHMLDARRPAIRLPAPKR
jgi:hypothetical protein